MTDPHATYDPRRFRSTVPYYARYRAPYPARLVARVVEILGLTRGDAVMDLGCGPGPLAVLFAQAGMTVTGIDPEPDMLEAARAAAADAGVELDLRQGSSFDLPPDIGPFRLVTMGRSFHWMDRAATLAVLDGLIAQGGAVVLFADRRLRTIENAWRRVLEDVGRRYGRADEAHIKERESASHRSHEAVLLDSVFCDLESVGTVVRRVLSADDVVGLAFSLSTSSPDKLGERVAQFEAELRAALAALSPEGRFVEIVEMQALVARR
jgi:SAM-dependent methyltransferase